MTNINFEADAESTTGVASDDKLKRVSTLADAALACAELVDQLESRVKEEKTRLRELVERQLPEAMASAGMEKFTTTEGAEVSVKREVYATISEANRVAAHAWLREHGHGDLIKNTLTVTFGAGEDTDAAGAKSLLEASGLSYGGIEQREGVHPQTLRVFVREQVEGGRQVPLDLFGAHLATLAKIKRKQEK